MITGYDLDVLLNESYEQSYGIFDHNSSNANPLSIVSMHASERYTEGSGLYNLIGRYIKHSIRERFGLSLIEFMHLPREFTEELIRLSALGMGKPAASDAALKELEQQLRQSK